MIITICENCHEALKVTMKTNNIGLSHGICPPCADIKREESLAFIKEHMAKVKGKG